MMKGNEHGEETNGRKYKLRIQEGKNNLWRSQKEKGSRVMK